LFHFISHEQVKNESKLFRDREDHLTIFLHHLHPILQRQQLNYQIFVIEQSPEEFFNRGALMNIGFVEALKVSEDFDCFVFHDVNLLSEDDR
jgi:beta-1,4-galactosyltransferase 1